jgi:hypothetical protein
MTQIVILAIWQRITGRYRGRGDMTTLEHQ